ncbi:MAG TPA: DUF998 domain-containing protein, partial [Actinopolymorphaceae bacterium]|nr:DUF998 domain-containing protein [Actinopolymorphaceae bacterium]
MSQYVPTTNSTGQSSSTSHPDRSCDPAARVTKSLLGYGVIAGPFYVVVSLVQALTRDGFDISRHSWSLLSNGSHGWIQVTNFIVTGLMTLAAAVGLGRALRPGPGATWAPRLVGVYGVALVAAGIFRADPSLGFPEGTPEGMGAVSWHGFAHLASGAVGFLCLIAACFVLARSYGRRAALLSRAVGTLFALAFAGIVTGATSATVNLAFTAGVVFFAGFAGIASGAGTRLLTLAFVASVIVAWTWVSAVSIHLYRRT